MCSVQSLPQCKNSQVDVKSFEEDAISAQIVQHNVALRICTTSQVILPMVLRISNLSTDITLLTQPARRLDLISQNAQYVLAVSHFRVFLDQPGVAMWVSFSVIWLTRYIIIIDLGVSKWMKSPQDLFRLFLWVCVWLSLCASARQSSCVTLVGVLSLPLCTVWKSPGTWATDNYI